MNNVLQFKSNAEIMERGRIQDEIIELTGQILYLEGLITNSCLSEIGAPINFKFQTPIRGVVRINLAIRKEISIMKGRRTRLRKKMENL